MLHLSSRTPERLVVFVHGFRDRAVGSWQELPGGTHRGDWWNGSDLLFVGYERTEDAIDVAAGRMRHQLPRLYPHLPDTLTEIAGVRARAASSEPYRQLILVGHALGAAIVRRVLREATAAWVSERGEQADLPRPALLDAMTRLPGSPGDART